MRLIVTPSRLEQMAEFYHQLGEMLSAGLTMPKALETLYQHPPARALKDTIGRLRNSLVQGRTVAGAVQQMPDCISAFDMALIEAGDMSGRLDACFKLLALYYQDRARMVRTAITELLYPAFLFHFAVYVMPLINYFRTGRTFTLIAPVLFVFLPLYGAVFFLLWSCQGRRGEEWRGWIERLLHPIPILGTARRYLALARFAAALEALLTAGVPIITGLELAAAACGSPALRRAVLAWKEPLQHGQTPAELMSRAREFPEMFANQFYTGEVSGKLDGVLLRLHGYYQGEGARKMRLASQLITRGVYFAVAGLVAWRVISFYLGRMDEINDIHF